MLAQLTLRRPATLQWHKPLLQTSRSISTTETTKNAVRLLLRQTAQPVAVVTSFYPVDGDDCQPPSRSRFHGATLSSFTSIALDPHPLVAFSLKIPSRMASSLKSMMSEPSSNPGSPTLVINLLSSTQEETAAIFARSDLYHEPFRITPYQLTKEGLPVLSGSLGALSCSVLSCTPLHALKDPGDNAIDSGGLVSELFISRVQRVESNADGLLPLLYHQRKYATTSPLHV